MTTLNTQERDHLAEIVNLACHGIMYLAEGQTGHVKTALTDIGEIAAAARAAQAAAPRAEDYERMRKALTVVANWALPQTGKFWDEERTRPTSYEAEYGSQGARAYMQQLAANTLLALSASPAAAQPSDRLLQDETQTSDSKALSRWFAGRPNARQEARDAAKAIAASEAVTREWAADLLGIPRGELSIDEFSDHQKERIALVMKGAEAALASAAPAAPLTERQIIAYAVLSTHSGDVQEVDLFKKRESAERHCKSNGGIVVGLASAATVAQPVERRVGDSLFESWLSEHPCTIEHWQTPRYAKQHMREAYEAGLNERQPAVDEAVTREKLIALIADRLSGTYHCTRVWSAWGVGTMSQDDFEDVGESDTPAELANAILTLFARSQAEAKGEQE